MIWWSSPKNIISFLLLPSLAFLFLFERNVRGWYLFVDNLGKGILYVSLFLLFLMLSFVVVDHRRAILRSDIPKNEIRFNFSVGFERLFYLTIVGYSLWFKDLLVHPKLITLFFSHEVNSLRSYIVPQDGAGTLCQFAPVYCALWGFAFRHERKYVQIKYNFYLIIVLSLALIKAFLWSERLALIECMIPIVLAFYPKKAPLRILISFIPFTVPIIFGITEYFRSWNYYNQIYDSYFTFILDRIYSYYAASVSNGINLWINHPFDPFFHYLWGWILNSPFFGSKFALYFEPNYYTQNYLLERATPEFNTFTGVFPLFISFSIVGAFIVTVFLGYFLAVSFRDFRSGQHSRKAILYPFGLIFLLEILRINYLFEGRFLAILFGIMLIPRIQESTEVNK